MSVRRLADESIQPASFAFNRAFAAEAKNWIRKYPKGREQSAVIPLLMLAQEQEGWVTRPALETVAGMLEMPLIRVLEVATFYTQFQLAPVGTKAHIQVCGTTPCALRGAGDLIDLCKRRIHPEPLHLNEAGTLSWEEVECQGACVNAPMIMIFKDTYEDLTAERLEEIIDAFEAGKGGSVRPGPQIDRMTSAPVGGPTTLIDEKAVLKKSGRQPAAKGAGGKAGADPLPPSKSARPKTHAAETDEKLVSPSKVKTSSNGENATSAAAPRHDERRADRASEEVEATHKTRAHSGKRTAGPAALKAPELKRGKASGTTQEPSRSQGRPAGMEKPAKPDDLKMISGVGPKIEGILNGLGIYTYAQISAWKKAERAWVDDHLNFRGRVEREDWVKQAKALAKGGAAEYERVFGKKPR